jgi:hypothetical protein
VRCAAATASDQNLNGALPAGNTKQGSGIGREGRATTGIGQKQLIF